MSATTFTLRPYSTADEDAAIELWRRTWSSHYPHLDFNARQPWWRERWRNELVPSARIAVAERDGAIIGFVTIDPKTMYLDQIVVAPEHWGSDVALALLDEAMDELGDEDREALLLRYFKHLDFRAIGASLAVQEARRQNHKQTYH